MLHSHRWRSSSERLVSLLAAMTTTPPPIPARGGENTKPEVSVVVTPGATTASSVSFTVAPQNADKCAYVCLKNVEGIELPDAVSVMAEGRQLEKVEDAACRGERTRSRSRVCRIGGRFGRGERPRPVGTDHADDRESQSGHYDGGDACRGRADREHAFVHGHYRQCRRVPLPLFQEDRRFRSARQIRHLRHGRQGGDLLSAGDFCSKTSTTIPLM